MAPFDLGGKRALVTGSGGGIGLAIATALAAAGATIILNGRNADKLAAAGEKLAAAGHRVELAPFAVTQPDAVAAGVRVIEKRLGGIDILVNNAGIQHRESLERFPDEAWDRLLATNLSSAFYVSRAAVRGMIERRAGKIINIASVQAELGRATIAPYAATKGALKMLTRGMCADWARHNIQANALAPGYFDTELNATLVADSRFSEWLCARTPAGRWGRLDELGGTAVFLASAASDFINGQTIYVDGGLTSVV